jgi:hypothetical protein
MNAPATVSEIAPRQRRWRILLAMNLGVGVLLWFFYSTDFSWAGTIPDIAFPPLVAMMSLVSLLISRKAPSRRQRQAAALACLPSLIGGWLYILVAGLLVMPPFTLGAFFMIDEISHEKLIQEAVSPDGSLVAQVCFRGVGAYGPGNGRTYVRVKHRLLPVVEKDVYHLHGSHADESTADYLWWRDTGTLYIPETQEEVAVGTATLRMPNVFAIPARLFVYTAWLLTGS